MICTANIGKIYYRHLQKCQWIKLLSRNFYYNVHHEWGNQILGMFIPTLFSSLCTKTKFIKNNWLHTMVSTRSKQTLITSVSLGLLQRNKDFWTLEQANKMIPRFWLLVPSFTEKMVFKKFTEFCFSIYTSIFPTAFNALYWKLRLAWLCQVFADLVTYEFIN